MPSLNLADRTISTKRSAFVMGIVNCTPDSFFAGSRGSASLALRLADEGADILDIGGESTRPGWKPVSTEEEIRRIVPVIRAVRKKSPIPISVDTRKKSVMEAAFNEGADIVNDVSALEDDEELGLFAAQKNLPVILMHRGNCSSGKSAVCEVGKYLSSRADYALSCGIGKEKIIVDPGIGFGKDDDVNRALIADCGSLCEGTYPVLMALSRKRVIGSMTGRDAEERLYGTLAADLVAVLSGASFVRVHDVAPCVDSLAVLSALRNI